MTTFEIHNVRRGCNQILAEGMVSESDVLKTLREIVRDTGIGRKDMIVVEKHNAALWDFERKGYDNRS